MLEINFQAADVPIQDSARKAVAAIKSADHETALAELKSLVRSLKLTPEQRGAIREVMAKLERNVVRTPVLPETPSVRQGPLVVNATH